MRRDFTLIEMVVGIIAILATILFPVLAKAPEKGLSAPRLEIYRSLSIPWVGLKVQYQAALRGAQPGSAWEIALLVASPRGARQFARRRLVADEDGQALLSAEIAFAIAGWYEVRGEARGTSDMLQATVQVPVTQRRVDFAWYQAEKGHELRWVTIQLTAREEDREYWRWRGVLPARWCGAMCGKEKPLEHFARAWSSDEAIAIEFHGRRREVAGLLR